MNVAVDLFAGLGGFTEGASLAGVEVAWAANHSPAAVRWHERNHPGVEHACQDLQQADWSRVPSHDVLLASPACQGHTRARGRERPHHDATRATAWAVVACAEVHRPRRVVVENVPEFQRWVLWPSWLDALARLGYATTATVLDAADAGVPQNRLRLFVVGSLDGPVEVRAPVAPRVPASSFVDFDRGRWTPVSRRGRAPATLARIEAGRREHGDRFLVPYYGNAKGGRSLARPIGTITTRDRWAVVDGGRMRMLRVAEAKAAMGFRRGYVLPADGKVAMHLLGNAVPPALAAHVVSEATRN